MGLVTLAALAAGVWFARGIRPWRRPSAPRARWPAAILAAPLPPATADEVSELITALGHAVVAVRVVGTIARQRRQRGVRQCADHWAMPTSAKRTEGAGRRTGGLGLLDGATRLTVKPERLGPAERLARGPMPPARTAAARCSAVVETVEHHQRLLARRIAEIIGTIGGIAFQTNILAPSTRRGARAPTSRAAASRSSPVSAQSRSPQCQAAREIRA